MCVGFKIACLSLSSGGIDEVKASNRTIAKIGFDRDHVFPLAVGARSVKVYRLDLIIRRL
jgi:hypothetical protein